MELDKLNGNSRWSDATKMEMDQINEYKVFKDHVKANVILNQYRSPMPLKATRES